MSQRTSITCGLVLLIFGIFLLLTTLGVVQIDLWGFLIPALMIAFGALTLWMVLTRRGTLARSEVHAALEGAKSARVRVRFGAGRLTLRGDAPEAEVGSVVALGGVQQKATTVGDVRSVEWSVPTEFLSDVLAPWKWSGGQPPSWEVRLRPGMPIDLNLETGACEMDLDLTSLQVGELRLLTGASSAIVRMPAAAGETRSHITVGAAGVKVRIPVGVAARIHVEAGLGEVQVDRGRFPGGEGRFESADYATARNKIDLALEVGAASVEVS